MAEHWATSLCMICIRAYLNTSFTLAWDGSQRAVLHSSHFIPRGRTSWHSLDRKTGATKCWYELSSEENNPLVMPQLKGWLPSLSLVIYRLSYLKSYTVRLVTVTWWVLKSIKCLKIRYLPRNCRLVQWKLRHITLGTKLLPDIAILQILERYA